MGGSADVGDPPRSSSSMESMARLTVTAMIQGLMRPLGRPTGDRIDAVMELYGPARPIFDAQRDRSVSSISLGVGFGPRWCQRNVFWKHNCAKGAQTRQAIIRKAEPSSIRGYDGAALSRPHARDGLGKRRDFYRHFSATRVAAELL